LVIIKQPFATVIERQVQRPMNQLMSFCLDPQPLVDAALILRKFGQIIRKFSLSVPLLLPPNRRDFSTVPFSCFMQSLNIVKDCQTNNIGT
jgi:hypothetical protein